MYPTNQGSNIGTLLRMIREDQNQNIAATPPATQPGSAIREVVQQPLSSPNDPNSARVVSVRPEGVTQQGPDTQVTQPVAPASPAAAPPVVAPTAPKPAAPSVSSPSASRPSSPSAQPSRPAQSAPSFPSIGTTIKAAAPTPRPSPSEFFTPKPGLRYFTPQRSSVGVKVSNKPGPTPTPRPGKPWGA
jgi:hypothetical protein